MQSEAPPAYLSTGIELQIWSFPANRPFGYKTILGGPYEVNFAYYPGMSLTEGYRIRYVLVDEEIVEEQNKQKIFYGMETP